MPSQRVRMVDVAKAAGVSQTTASFVLNHRDVSIPDETRERVLCAARQMGYRPHAGARALATGRTQRLGLALNESESFRRGDTYFTEVIAGIIDGAVGHGMDLALHSAHYPDLRKLERDILNGSTDGVLLVGRYTGDPLTTALLEAGFPTVCISYYVDHPDCLSVDCDNAQGAYLAIRHLLDLGHRRIAFFYPGEVASWGRERLQGARRAVEEAGLQADELLVDDWSETALPESQCSQDWMARALELLRSSTPRITAMVCVEEARARWLAEMLPEAGLRVPHDVSVISFNSTEMSARARPPLTSVWQPLKLIGAAAVDLLIDRIEGRVIQQPIRRFPTRLDVRESCTAPAPDGRAVVRGRATASTTNSI